MALVNLERESLAKIGRRVPNVSNELSVNLLEYFSKALFTSARPAQRQALLVFFLQFRSVSERRWQQ